VGKLRNAFQRVTLTHVLLFVLAVCLGGICWELYRIDHTLRVINCNLPDAPCQTHYY
jgi:hypothetical protein